MGNWIVDLTNYVRASNSAMWGQAAFAYQLPEGSPSPSVVLVPPIEGLRYDRYLPDWYRGTFQAIATGDNIAQVNEAGRQILRTLTLYNTLLGGTDVQRCTADSIPVVYPISDSDLFEVSVTFNITFIDTRIRTGV